MEEAVATRDFTAESDTELGLRVGDRVTVTDYNGQWAYGNMGGQAGWFPADHVAPANDRAPRSAQPPPTPYKPPKASTQAANNPGRFGAPNNGPSHAGTGPGKVSSFADNLKRIQNQLGGANIGGAVASPSPQQDGYRPGLSSRESGINYTQVPVFNNDSIGNSYNHNGQNGFNNHPQKLDDTRFNEPRFPPNNNAGYGFGNGPNVPANPPPPKLPAANRRRSSSSGGLPLVNTPPSPGASKANYSFQFCVETQHPYTATSGDQLTFAAREKLDIIERPSPSSDWWRARNKAGEIGLVPTNYVKEIPQSTPVLAERLWYLYKIKRVETEQRMRRQPTECFVIRDSEAFPGSFTLSVKGPDKVRHIKITTVTDGYHVGDKKFHSLDAVVDFYRNSPIYIADDGSYKLLLCKALGNARI